MLIKGEEKRGFIEDQIRLCKVVEFGARPAKRARLDFLEASDGDTGDEPMSESNSGVTHEPRSGLKVITSSDHMEESRNTHGLDDTISTSDDDRLFVIQVRSPKSRQLLHEKPQEDGGETKVDSAEVDSGTDPRAEELLRVRSDGDAATKSVQSEMSIPEAECGGEPQRTQENDGSGRENEGALGERMIKHYVRRPQSRADSHEMTEKSDPGEAPKVYVRTRKQQGSATQVAAAAAAAGSEEGGDPLGESTIKHYVRRPHSRANSHGPDQSSSGPMMMTSSATNVSACSPQAENTRPSRIVETEGILSVFQRRSRTNPDLQKKEEDSLNQKKLPLKSSSEPRYVRADRQPRWLPEGWSLQIRIREGKKFPARIRDKYYHDEKTGLRFRSRNEVLQFLYCGRVSAEDGTDELQDDETAQLQDEAAQLQQDGNHSLPLPISPAGFQSPPVFQSPPSLPKIPTIPAMPPCAVSTEAFRADMSWGHVEGPKGPIPLPWGPHGHGRMPKRPLTASPVPVAESPSGENRGKLILRLKRKQPDSDAGKGKSKRPTYEVVHVERPPLTPPSPPAEAPVKDITYQARRPYISTHWGMDRHAPHHQHLDVVQNLPYTALGIPATAHTSGLQTMAAYSANHTHVFLDPIENTLPLSWQLGPFSTFSFSTTPSTLALPCYENKEVPCSENKSRDSLSDGENGPPRERLLSKGESSRLLVGLGRRLCLDVSNTSTRKIGV